MPTFFSRWLLVAGLLTGLSHGQVLLDPAAVPVCALSCPVLNQVSSTCLPPVAPTTDQAAYDACFCTSSLLASLFQTPDGLCDKVCTSESDRIAIQNWYKGKCAAVSATTNAAPTTPLATVFVTTTPPSAAKPTAVLAQATTSTPTPRPKYVAPPPPSWISTHWKWVIMLVVVCVGFIILGVGGVWLRRRHERKHQSYRQASMPGDPAANVECPLPIYSPGGGKGFGGKTRWPSQMSQSTNHSAGGNSTFIGTDHDSRGSSRTGPTFDTNKPTGLRSGQDTIDDGRSSRRNSLVRRLSFFSPVSRPRSNNVDDSAIMGPQFHQAQTRGYEYYPSEAGGQEVRPSVPTPPMPATQRPNGFDKSGGSTTWLDIPEERPDPSMPMTPALRQENNGLPHYGQVNNERANQSRSPFFSSRQ